MMGFQPPNRSWRKKKQRAVSPIIATILLVAITVVLAAVLYILISGLTKGPGNTPLGSAYALNPPREQSNSAHHWYNFSVASASGGLILNSLAFQVQMSGSIVTATTFAMTVVGINGGASIATYSFTTNSWSVGGTLSVTNQMTLVLDTLATSVSGDTLVTVGGGSFSGQVSTAIP